MLRVLQIVSVMNRGGLETRLMDIFRNIDRSQIIFDFYTNSLEKGEYDKEIEELGGIVYKSSPLNIFSLKSKEEEFKSFCISHPEYCIVHSHVNEWSTIFCKAAEKAHLKIRIAHSRGANTTVSVKWLIKQILKKNICKYATHYFAVSEIAAKYLFGNKIVDSGKVYIVPNAIDCNTYKYNSAMREKKRSELGINKNMTFIHVGNFTEAKNHPFLIDVFAEESKIHNDAILLLAGDGDNSNIIKMVKQKGIEDKVFFLGKRTDVNGLLFAADCFLFPSKHEGFPGAVLEAETSGLICLISDRITPEVKLSNQVIMLPLIKRKWVDEIERQIHRIEHYDRNGKNEIVVRAGYDIRDVCLFYLNFYMECME